MTVTTILGRIPLLTTERANWADRDVHLAESPDGPTLCGIYAGLREPTRTELARRSSTCAKCIDYATVPPFPFAS